MLGSAVERTSPFCWGDMAFIGILSQQNALFFQSENAQLVAVRGVVARRASLSLVVPLCRLG